MLWCCCLCVFLNGFLCLLPSIRRLLTRCWCSPFLSLRRRALARFSDEIKFIKKDIIIICLTCCSSPNNNNSSRKIEEEKKYNLPLFSSLLLGRGEWRNLVRWNQRWAPADLSAAQVITLFSQHINEALTRRWLGLSSLFLHCHYLFAFGWVFWGLKWDRDMGINALRTHNISA